MIMGVAWHIRLSKHLDWKPKKITFKYEKSNKNVDVAGRGLA